MWITKGAFKRVDRAKVPAWANIIFSHVVYRRKDDGTAKARVVPWVHSDPARFDLRCDLPFLNPDTFRILSIAAEMRWRIAQMDAEACSFLQPRGFLCEIYVGPPKKAGEPGVMWQLLAAAYGLADSGRLWYRTNNDALVNAYHLTCSKYEPTLYYHKNASGNLDFVLVVQVDNYLYCGEELELSRFEDFLQGHFKMGSLELDAFPFLGCELVQMPDCTITI